MTTKNAPACPVCGQPPARCRFGAAVLCSCWRGIPCGRPLCPEARTEPHALKAKP